MSSHVEYCGSRTQKCDACHRFIQIKDFTEHENSGCQYPIKEESKQLPQSKPRHEIFSGVPVDMFNGMGEIDSSDAEYRFNPFLAAINGFGQILTSGLGTPPFGDAHMNPRGGAAHYGFDENGMFGKHGVVSRGASKGQGSQNPEADHRNFQDFDEINDEYAVHVDDDEILAAAYQTDEFGYVDGDSEWMSAAEVDKHVPYTKSTLLPDSGNGKCCALLLGLNAHFSSKECELYSKQLLLQAYDRIKKLWWKLYLVVTLGDWRGHSLMQVDP